jgi:hypothetical protein
VIIVVLKNDGRNFTYSQPPHSRSAVERRYLAEVPSEAQNSLGQPAVQHGAILPSAAENFLCFYAYGEEKVLQTAFIKCACAFRAKASTNKPKAFTKMFSMTYNTLTSSEVSTLH